MTGSPVFSLNLTYLGIPANPNYHMSIKKSQAILKCFITGRKDKATFTNKNVPIELS